MDVVISVLMSLVLIVLTTIGWFLKDTPNLLRELKVEKLRGMNEQNLQIESYFREISGRDLNEVLSKWSTVIDDISNNNMTKKQIEIHMKNLTTKTFMYGSPRTIVILGIMQQHSYNNGKVDNNINIAFGKEKEIDYSLIVLTSFIIASLKEDFTGYKISPLDFLRMKITDYNEPKIYNKIKKAESDMLIKLKEEGYEWRRG